MKWIILGALALAGFAVATPAEATHDDTGTVKFRRPLRGAPHDWVTHVGYYSHGDVDKNDGGKPDDYACGGSLPYSTHRGTDYYITGMYENRPVAAAAGGTVISVGDGCKENCWWGGQPGCGDCKGGLGNYVTIDHGEGTATLYMHLRKGVKVKKGQKVGCGDLLGYVGSSGASGSPHLHFEPRKRATWYVGGSGWDPYTGLCHLGKSRWVDQNGYKGLPAALCE